MKIVIFLIPLALILLSIIGYQLYSRAKKKYREFHAMGLDLQSQLHRVQSDLQQLDQKLMQMNQHIVLEHIGRVLENSGKEGWLDESQVEKMTKILDTAKLDNLRGDVGP